MAADPVSRAAEQLYALTDLDQFTARRSTLAAAARSAGDRASARAIAALRRPTKSAWTVNLLVRAFPDVAGRFVDLGAQLRAAQRSFDGQRLKELSAQRRTLVDDSARKAFEVTGQTAPSAALHEEVTSTLRAALADPAVAEQFSAATLVRAASWSGFGSAAELSLVPMPVPQPNPVAKPKPNPVAKPKPKLGHLGERRVEPEPDEDRGEQERRRAAVVDAEQALADAARDQRAAAEEARSAADVVGVLTEQLADARRRLDDARLQLRHTDAARRKAQQALAAARVRTGSP